MAAGTEGVDARTREIDDQENDDGFQGVSAAAGDRDDRDNGGSDEEEGHERAGSGEDAKPERSSEDVRAGKEQGNSEQREVGDGVAGESPDLQEFEGFLIAHADEHGDAGEQCDHAEEKNGVDGSAVLLIQASEPSGEEVVPTGAHGQAAVSGEIQAKAGEIVGEQTENRERNEEVGQRRIVEGYTEGLGNGADNVDLIGRDVGKNRAGAEDVQQGDDGRGDEDGSREVAGGIAGLSGKDGGVFETAESAKGHFGENAETEEGERRSGEMERAVGGSVREKERQEREESDDGDGQGAAEIADPFSGAEAEVGDKHQCADDGDGSHEDDDFMRGDGVGIKAKGVGEIGDSDQADGGDIENDVKPEIPGDEKADGVAEGVARPFVETAFERKAGVEMRDDESLGNEEERDGQEPEDEMGGAGFDGGAEEIGNNHQKNRSKQEVEEAQFLAKTYGG